MASITIDSGALRVELSPWDKFLALHGSFQIPLEHITGIRVADEDTWRLMWRKVVGTNLPNVKTAGTFYADGLIFCDVRDGKACIEIDLEHETYRTLIVQLEDLENPQRVAEDLNAALARYQSAPSSIKI